MGRLSFKCMTSDLDLEGLYRRFAYPFLKAAVVGSRTYLAPHHPDDRTTASREGQRGRKMVAVIYIICSLFSDIVAQSMRCNETVGLLIFRAGFSS